ncbi:MAG: NAD+ synthase [Planctomycetales bacterium]
MKIALAQLNPTVGDLTGNVHLVLNAAQQAAAEGAELLIASELLISGYPPKDLLLRKGFVQACLHALVELAKQLPPDLGVLVGHPAFSTGAHCRPVNAASLLHQGEVRATIHKSLLPNYDVFDEQRYFLSAAEINTISFQGRTLGVHICEDAWWGEAETCYHVEAHPRPDPVAELVKQGAEVLINLSASPFQIDKPHRRVELLRRHVLAHQRPFLFVNQVGGNDDLVFDGHSLVLNAQGQTVLQMQGFQSEVRMIDLDQLSPVPEQHGTREEELLDALILGLRDYVHKSGFTDGVLGLSGGIDSALAAYIAAEALGPAHVHGLALPSRYSSDHSLNDAAALAKNLGIDYQVIPIDAVHRAYEGLPVVSEDLSSQPGGLADQNLQARIRGAIVMERSNRHGWMALSTGNKSELAMGYCTLYGDMAGGFAVLCDVYKQDVYGLARHINSVREKREAIPHGSIEKPPSAELAPNQLDQDTLPPYPILDAILTALIDQEASAVELSQKFPPETVRWVISRLDRNEFKRRQIPPGIKVSQRAFGSGRRMPMAARFPLC